MESAAWDVKGRCRQENKTRQAPSESVREKRRRGGAKIAAVESSSTMWKGVGRVRENVKSSTAN